MKKIVVFGGGTGLSTLLSGLKEYELDITAVVTIADNGGSTGKIRKYYDIPAPGDIRRCAIALSNDEQIKSLMNYRFDLNIQNHTIGNLILAALTDLNGNMSEAIKSYCKLLNVEKEIYPVSNESLVLSAQMEDNTIVHGETKITNSKKKIKKVFYEGNPQVYKKVISAINNADAVIFSSGSLYTSIIPNLIFHEIQSALENKNIKKIYVSNIVTQNGETNNYKLSDHINVINNHLKTSEIDIVFANNNYNINEIILAKYALENSEIVKIDIENIKTKIIADNYIYVDENDMLRHNVKKVSKQIVKYVNNNCY